MSSSSTMLDWLRTHRATGLGHNELTLFPFANTGRGVMTLASRKKGEEIFTIPEDCFLTAKGARKHHYLGELLLDAHVQFTDDEVLAIYILYIKSRVHRYDEYKHYLGELPTQYTSPVFFTDEELGVCAGSSLYTLTKVLQLQIQDDYKKTNDMLFRRFPDNFPSGVFTLQNVSVYMCILN